METDKTTQPSSGTKNLKIILPLFLLVVLAAAAFFYFQSAAAYRRQAQQAVRIYDVAGSGSGLFAMKFLTDDFAKRNLGVKFNILPSADTAVGIAGVKNKSISIGAGSRRPKAEEEFPELVTTVLGNDAITFVVHSALRGVSDLSAEQLAGVYTGKIKNWKELGGDDEMIVVVDREEAESAKKVFRQVYLGQADVSLSAVEVHSDADMLKAIMSTPNSIGYLPYARAKVNDLKSITIDGVSASEVGSGKYKFYRELYIFSRTDSPEDVKRFIDYSQASPGREALAGYYF